MRPFISPGDFLNEDVLAGAQSSVRRDEGFTPAAAKSAEATADILPGFNGEEKGQGRFSFHCPYVTSLWTRTDWPRPLDVYLKGALCNNL